MAKEKKVANYSEQDVATLKSVYKGVDNVAEVTEISKQTGKTPASVRAKLASLGLYKVAEKSEDSGEKITKMVIAEAIGEKIELLEHEVEGLAKASKSALTKILAKLA